MIRRPPRSTLFPTRRSSDLLSAQLSLTTGRLQQTPRSRIIGSSLTATRRSRSEEHTSELQSHVNLVCRLLLEKKNTLTPHPLKTECKNKLKRFSCNVFKLHL